MTNLSGKKTSSFQYVAAVILALALFPGQTSAEQRGKPAIKLGPGSAHPGTTGEVRLELESFLLGGDPHACGIIWDLTVDEKKGELYVLCEPKRVGGVGEVRVFDRSGAYLRTILPFNPTLPNSSVSDISQQVVREDGTELNVPKFDLSWGEPSFYGGFWDGHKKIALAPDGDLVISDLYRGKLMRIGTDGSLPEEGWNTGAAGYTGVPGSGMVNYLPFDSLRYPYFHFGPDGSLYISGGQSSFETRYYHYNLEGGVNKARYHFPVEGDRSAYVWKLGLKPGPKAEKQGIVGGFKQASGIVVNGDHIIVADAGNNRIQVCTIDGEVVASIAHYMDKGKRHRILDPTALAMDRDNCLYVLLGSEERPEDLRTEGSIRFVQDALHTSAFEEPPPPRKLIKLKSWNAPELLAKSARVHTYVMQIAVDAGVTPPLVWVANGDGPGSLQQLSGADLSLQAQWQDDGTTLSNPRQDSGMPILNIDPETGHVYVEDDARYRHKKFGTAYRLDQQGNILKKWDPYFIDIEESGLISPWGATNLERGFPHPEEPLFLDSIFGKDGRVYRWRLGEQGISILRFDRSGKPIPFASTGSHELFVDAVPTKGRFYKKAHLRKQLTCWWDVYSGMEIDSEGNIYYAKKQDRYVESGMMLPRYGLHRQLDVYDSTGKLKQKALLDLTSVKGIQVDKEGYLYIVHIPADGRPPEKRVDRAKARAPKRYPMRPFALSKFAPTGGEPLWSQPWDGNHGMGFIPPNPHCICSTHRVNQALDDKGYIYMATKHSVQVVDTETGNVVGEFGSYGNADCKGKGSAYPHPELPFGTISSLAVWKDKLFVMDVLNRRLVKLNIAYDPTLKSAISSDLNVVPADEIDWGWSTPPTFPNEAYGPRTDVNPDLIGDNHLFDVWVPDGDGPYPVMIYAHGGGFKSGSKVKAIGGRPKLAEDNTVFISINYTLGQGAAVGVQDGIDAIKYIKANHEKYKIDPEKIFLSGNSAGGIMMNHIIYDLKMPGILGTWHGAYYRTQFADLSIDNLREVGIPIAISMSKLYPADPGHSPLAAVTLLENNVAAGNSGMWIGSTDGTVEQVWLNGKWIINANDGINIGESYPDVAEWIHSISSHGVTQAELSGLDAIMLRAIEQGTIKGCSFLVAHKGKIVYKKAHGAFTTEEQVPLASVSKPFAASVIMALAEQGKLDLEDPVEKYLPEFKGIRVKGSETPARPMTIRHVLSHMAGFWGNKGITREKMALIRDFSQTLEESVLGAAQYELIHEPGTKWTYSGIGYCVAGRVAEAALGDQSFEKVAQEALFRPLGMTGTSFNPTESRPFILVGGSLRSTLDDMAVFGQMHLNDGEYNGTQFLSKASVTEQRKLQIPEERFRAPGLGWHRGFPDENGLADLVFISGASGPHFQVDRRRRTVTVFLVRTSLKKVVPLFTDLNLHVEKIFPVAKDR